MKNKSETDFKNTMMETPAGNKRFGASGGVTSNNLLCGIDRLWF